MGGGLTLLFTNNKLLFFLLFSGNFCGDKVLMEGDKVAMGDPPVPALWKTLCAIHILLGFSAD